MFAVMALELIQVRENQLKNATLAIAYLSTGWLTQRIIAAGFTACPIWFAAGLALSALLIWGEQVWIGIFLGDFLLSVFLGVSWIIGLASAVGSTLSAVLAARWLRQCKFSPTLGRIRDIILLVLLAGIIAPIINATIDNTIRLWTGQLDWDLFAKQWWLLWLGDCTGILVFTPFLLRLTVDGWGLIKRQPKERLTEAAICVGLLLGVGWVVFGYNISTENPFEGSLSSVQYLEYLPFPFIVWAALRFQTWGAVTVNFLIAILALIGALEGVGPFVIQTPNLSQAVLLLQLFIAIVTTTSLFLSAAVSEGQRAEKQLRLTLEREHLLTDIALRIRQSLDLEQIFQTTVTEIRDFLNADRVYIGAITQDQPIKIVAESVVGGYKSLLGLYFPDEFFQAVKSLFTQQEFLIIDDISKVDCCPLLRNYFYHTQIKAGLVVPLMANNQQLGVLVVHQCSRIRYWQKSEVKLLEQLATQVSIAIQQAQLYYQVQQFNLNLEKEVKDRTQELQERMEEVRELYEMKNVFLQAVYHDLRTSFMGLMMLLKNLQNRSGDNISISRSILDRIVQSGDRQLMLINALSEDHFSEHHSLVLHCQPLSLRELVENLSQDWQSLFKQNQVRLINLVPANLPHTKGDLEQIKSVFNNIITNALKHNPPGITITVEATLEQGMIYCKLSDNGIGMDQQQCQSLFKLYVRSLYNTRRTGIGLGCYQCRQIIEAHGGKIGVNSTPGLGSQFWFTLPIAESSAQFGS
ncbi:multi-sensor signal transduction histidine kinase [Gloeothece citriformis PCC 7424]|uniref:histidine kinase n=1 Tax=Gloeothece citriformis (strain PCC 7424) TaxID=65393 RepID=B7KGT4_GLOC7|nr:MASE1 domain-containing protein [Gloeothece citriformis]ACK73421.1 multi-sensor signal transduction histidine kinase [Gloeothece citriformis PCC 7424]